LGTGKESALGDRRVGFLRSLGSAAAVALVFLLVPVELGRASGFIAGAGRVLGPGLAHRAWQLLTTTPSSDTWHVALVLALWVAWCWFVLCLLAETVASLRAVRRSPGHAPASQTRRRRRAGRAVAGTLVGPLVLALATQRAASATQRASAAQHLSAPPPAGRPHAEWQRMQALAPTPPASAGASAGAGGTAGPPGARTSLGMILMGLGGAATAFAVEEMRRLTDVREVRRLRRALAAATPAAPPAVFIEVPVVAAPAAPPGPSRAAAPAEPQEPELRCPAGAEGVLVRLLGEPLIEGAPGPFDRTKVVESLAYLVLHPDGVSKLRWATALWPDRALSQNSLNTAVWQLRRALGVDESGERRLPAARSGRLRLAADVKSDIGLLEECVAAGTAEALRAGLELVRGQPFDGLGSPDWVLLEGHASRVEELVAEAALALGRQGLDTGQAMTASWAARQGLKSCPYDERLYVLLADAADAAGNPAGASAALAERDLAVGPTGSDRAARAG
jgi:DNA-binding SARP family transcriptional activator